MLLFLIFWEILTCIGVGFCLLCISWNYYMVIFLYFAHLVNCIERFSNMKTTLHSWTKLHLVMMSYSFYMFLESICYYFAVDACFHEGSYSPSFFLPFLQYPHWVWVLQICWPHETNGEVFSERFVQDWCYIFHEYLVGFSNKSTWALSLELYAGFWCTYSILFLNSINEIL